MFGTRGASTGAGAFFALAVLAALFLLACSRNPAGANLIAEMKPLSASGVRNAQCLTDGIAADQNDPWDGDLSARFKSPASFVVYDLGRPVRVRRAFLQADADDSYELAVSDDGVGFKPIWTSRATSGSGLQDRWSGVLDAGGRFLRVTAGAGDGRFGASEIQVFDELPGIRSVNLRRKSAISPGELVRTKLALFAMAVMGLVLLARARMKPLFVAALALPALAAGIDLAAALAWAWPPGAREVAALRGAVGVVALAAIAREALIWVNGPPNKTVTTVTLAACASLAIACFYNLGHPQFWNHARQRPNFVHTTDMRVYFPVAKYFKELNYHGVYVASVAAATEDEPPASLDALQKIEFRDLRTNIMTTAAYSLAEVTQIKHRFSPERWHEFKRDMRYFRQTMGPEYFATMNDHGGNATPVWLAIAHGLFAWMPASNTTLFLTAMLDPLFLLIAFVAIGRTFGLRTMLVASVVFGATDLYMFGTNWAGSTLRHDWLAYLALGVCALRRERFVLAGALLALAGLIRAFPAVAILGAGLPLVWWVIERVRATRRLPRWSELANEQRWFGRMLLGAAACCLVAGLVSTLVLSPQAWSGWQQKIRLLSTVPHINDVSLRALVSGIDTVHARMLETRWPLFLAAALGTAALVLFAARGRRPEHGAILGLLLVPVVFAPANYYMHLVFLLPLVAIEHPRGDEPANPPGVTPDRAGALAWLFVLGMCAVQYFTVLVADARLHFYYETLIYFAATICLLWAISAPARAAYGSKGGH